MLLQRIASSYWYFKNIPLLAKFCLRPLGVDLLEGNAQLGFRCSFQNCCFCCLWNMSLVFLVDVDLHWFLKIKNLCFMLDSGVYGMQIVWNFFMFHSGVWHLNCLGFFSCRGTYPPAEHYLNYAERSNINLMESFKSMQIDEEESILENGNSDHRVQSFNRLFDSVYYKLMSSD